MRYLRKEAVLRCPIHTAIRTEAVNRLIVDGSFSKNEILEALNFWAVEESIRWDYIREFIQEDQGCELVLLAPNYFKRHRRDEEVLNPEKYIAHGYGKKTAGFAAAIQQNDHLVIAWKKLKSTKP